MQTLQAIKRTNEKPQALRESGMIPAICYGNGKEAIAIAVNSQDFVKTFKEVGETSTIELVFGNDKIATLIHDMQLDAITGNPMHIDFLMVDLNKEIEVAIPLEFTGLAEAEKVGLGTLVKVMHELTVSALPKNLLHAIEIDVTRLATLDDKIHVSDIVFPKGVTCSAPGEEVIALISAFTEEKEDVAPIDLTQIEVAEKGKKEDEESTESQ